MCDCVVKDSINFLDHINGKKHQRNLGMSMRVERSSLDQVKKRFDMKKKEHEQKKKDYDIEQRMRELKEEVRNTIMYYKEIIVGPLSWLRYNVKRLIEKNQVELAHLRL